MAPNGAAVQLVPHTEIMAMIQKIKIGVLKTDGLQTRAKLSHGDVGAYAQQMGDGVTFDPITVFFDGTDYYVADGFHRIEAHRRLCKEEIEADVRDGNRTDALRHALGANARHGRKLTGADMWHKLEIAWANRLELFGGEPSHELLARTCAVSVKTVQRFHKRISTMDSVQGSDPMPFVSVDGKKRTVTKISASPTMDSVQGSAAAAAQEPKATVARAIEESAAEEEEDEDDDLPPKFNHITHRTRKNVLNNLDRLGRPIPRRLRPVFEEYNIEAYHELEVNLFLAADTLGYFGNNPTFDVILGRKTIDDADDLNLGHVEGCVLYDIKEALKSVHELRPVCICEACMGSGKINGSKCPHCSGRGYQTHREWMRFVQQKHAAKDALKQTQASTAEIAPEPMSEVTPPTPEVTPLTVEYGSLPAEDDSTIPLDDLLAEEDIVRSPSEYLGRTAAEPLLF